MVASLLCALLIKHLAGLDGDLSVLAVAVAVTSGRTLRTRDGPSRLLAVVLLPVTAVIASLVGGRMLHQPVLGDTLFTLGIAAGIWLRRFGPRATAAGAVLTVPLIALLVVPVPVGGGAAHDAWSALVAAQAGLWCLIALTVAERTGLLTPAAASPPGVGGKLRTLGTTIGPNVRSFRARRPSRPPASTRMAVQMGLGLGAAFLIGHQLWPTHWTWIVISAFVVASGNRGRADVIHRCGLRIVGAAAGTVLATLLIQALPTGDAFAIVLILVTLTVGTALRELSYAYWAAAVTAVVALLNGYYGERSASLLSTRLEGIVLGGLLATVIALTVMPVRTGDVLRRRVADALAALTDYLTAARRRDLNALTQEHARFTHALARLEEIAPPLRLAQRFSRNPAQHPAAALGALRSSGSAVDRITARFIAAPELIGDEALMQSVAEFQAAVIKTRRSMARLGAAQAPAPTERPALPVAGVVALAEEIGALANAAASAQSDDRRSSDAE